MRRLRFVLVVLATFTLSLSFAVPAEDLPDTAYDESESLPYEMSLPLLSELAQESASARIEVILAGDSFPKPELLLGRARSEPAAHPNSDSLIILDHSLRC
jgi:hypothetical protein